MARSALRLGRTRPGRRELQNRRVTVWLCLRCCFEHRKPTKVAAAACSGRGPGFIRVAARPKVCEACRSASIEKFDSLAEAAHAALLMRLQASGAVDQLRFHPRLDVRVPAACAAGVESSVSYTADGTYLERDGRRVVYDVKAKGAPLEKDFALRRRIVQAAFGIEIQIVRR